MPAPFAALEARVNAVTHARIANATAAIAGYPDGVAGTFDNGFDPDLGMEGAKPSFRCLESQVPGIEHGTAMTIRGVDYEVAGVEPDGTGDLLLLLQLSS